MESPQLQVIIVFHTLKVLLDFTYVSFRLGSITLKPMTLLCEINFNQGAWGRCSSGASQEAAEC